MAALILVYSGLASPATAAESVDYGENVTTVHLVAPEEAVEVWIDLETPGLSVAEVSGRIVEPTLVEDLTFHTTAFGVTAITPVEPGDFALALGAHQEPAEVHLAVTFVDADSRVLLGWGQDLALPTVEEPGGPEDTGSDDGATDEPDDGADELPSPTPTPTGEGTTDPSPLPSSDPTGVTPSPSETETSTEAPGPAATESPEASEPLSTSPTESPTHSASQVPEEGSAEQSNDTEQPEGGLPVTGSGVILILAASSLVVAAIGFGVYKLAQRRRLG